jgi:hypothetical protein
MGIKRTYNEELQWMPLAPLTSRTVMRGKPFKVLTGEKQRYFMQYEIKRFLRIGLLFGFIGIVLVLSKTRNLGDAIKAISYPTLLFIPLAYAIKKFSLYETGEYGKKYSKIIGYITLMVMLIVAPKLPFTVTVFIIVIGFEMPCLCYYMMSRAIK